MSLEEALSACISPMQTARVFNPTRPEYYRADEVATAKKFDEKAAEPTVKVTLSEKAQATLKR